MSNHRLRARTPTGLSAPIASIAANLALAIVKLITGILCGAPALISDAAHSAADLFSTLILLVGLRLSARAPDKSHPYGHERFECLASILLSGILLITGISIGVSAVQDILSRAYLDTAPPGVPAAVIAFLSILAKLALSRYMSTVAKRLRSTALRAEALHQISDALASLAALLGIVMALLGFGIFELLASVVIAGFLLHAAFSIFKEAAMQLIDRSADEETEGRLYAAVLSVDGIVSVERLCTRLFGSRIYVEAELMLDASLTLSECAPIVRLAREAILDALPTVKDCTVTVVPKSEPPQRSELGQKP